MQVPNAAYLSMEYGPVENLPCNVHRSSGTQNAMRLHYHDFYQIYFLIRGTLIHSTEAESVPLQSGDTFILPPFSCHRIARGAEMPQFYSFSFRASFLPEETLRHPLVEALFSALAAGRPYPRITPEAGQLRQLGQLLELALAEFEARRPGWEALLQGLLSAILILLSRAYRPDLTLRPEGSVYGCVSYLDLHFREDVRLSDLLSQAHLSASAFSRAFRAATGRSFHAYLTERRLSYACGLLQETGKSVAAVAAACGYRDFSAFSRAFRAHFGVTPLQYRKSKKAP